MEQKWALIQDQRTSQSLIDCICNLVFLCFELGSFYSFFCEDLTILLNSPIIEFSHGCIRSLLFPFFSYFCYLSASTPVPFLIVLIAFIFWLQDYKSTFMKNYFRLISINFILSFLFEGIHDRFHLFYFSSIIFSRLFHLKMVLFHLFIFHHAFP